METPAPGFEPTTFRPMVSACSWFPSLRYFSLRYPTQWALSSCQDPGLNSDLMELSIQLMDRYEIYPLPGLLPQERVGMHGFTNNPDLTGPPYIISIIYPSALTNNKF